MSASDIAARVVDALDQAAAHETGAPVTLVSVAVEMLAIGDVAHVDARIERKTRTLVFAMAEAFGAGETRLASATSVHKIGTAKA